MTKKTVTVNWPPPKNDYQVIYTNTQEYDYFDIDASQLSTVAFLALTSSSQIDKEKWEVVLGSDHTPIGVRKELGRGRRMHHEFKEGEKQNLVEATYPNWRSFSDSLRLTIRDGSIEVSTNDNILIKYEDSSIKKNELRNMMVAEGWGDKPTTWTIKARVNDGKFDYFTFGRLKGT